MNVTGEKAKSISAIALVLILALAGMLGLFMASDDGPMGAESSKRDSKGYYFIDNKDPNPKVEYNWIDAYSTGTSLYNSGYGSYGYLGLTFDFPFYENTYTNLYVASNGYICFNSWYFTTSYSGGIPQSGMPNPLIAPYWGYSYGTAYYLFGGGGTVPRWVCIEWNTLYSGHNLEVILYETGVIKMQYKKFGTSYANGQSTTVGIEDSTGTVGLQYSGYNEVNMNANLAIEYSFAKLSFSDLTIEGDGDFSNPTAFAEYRYYKLDFMVSDDSPMGIDDLFMTRVYFGPIALGIYAEHIIAGGLPQWKLGGGNTSIDLDLISSDLNTSAVNSTHYHMVLYVMFKFSSILDGNIEITIWGRGLAALSKSMTVPDAMYVDSSVKTVGEFKAQTSKGRVLVNEDWTMENENVTFSGLTLIYNRSRADDPVNYTYPMNHTFDWSIVDDALMENTDRNASGRAFILHAMMPSKFLRREFKLYVKGTIPAWKVRTELPLFALRVDDSRPAAPQSLVVRADSFKDTQRSMDNDDVLFISWSSVKDTGSGVVNYRINDLFDPTNSSIAMVPPKDTEFIWNRTIEGIYTIYVWAEDYVGHVGEPASQNIRIDKTDPIFQDFSPTQIEMPWVKTLTPEIKIWAYDGEVETDGTSGIKKASVEYAVSTKGPDGFEEWISTDMFDDENNRQHRVEVKAYPRFVEGRDNLIKFRAMDRAGNGPIASDSYLLFIDVTEPRFEDFFPTPLVWHDQNIINNKEVTVLIVDETSGIKTPEIYYRVSNKLYPDGSFEWVSGFNQTGGWEQLPSKNWERLDWNNRIGVSLSYKEFAEGDMNYFQFLTRDVAGNGQYTEWLPDKGPWTVSPLYQILVNTKPVAVITEPRMNQEFLITDLVTFDATDSYDIDDDKGNLKFEWREGSRVLGYNMVQRDERFKTAGLHTITLYVGDSVHKYDEATLNDSRAIKTVTIKIVEEEKYPDLITDSDSDGIKDWWEVLYFMNPKDPMDAGLDTDLDGYTNLREYLGDDNRDPLSGNKDGNDPLDPKDHPTVPNTFGDKIVDEAPFGVWMFMVLVVVAIVLAAAIILAGYLRMNRKEELEKREEAEEEAMLATPQLEIPSMPMPMQIDTSVPTLPAPDAAVEPSQLPPAPAEVVAAEQAAQALTPIPAPVMDASQAPPQAEVPSFQPPAQ